MSIKLDFVNRVRIVLWDKVISFKLTVPKTLKHSHLNLT